MAQTITQTASSLNQLITSLSGTGVGFADVLNRVNQLNASMLTASMRIDGTGASLGKIAKNVRDLSLAFGYQQATVIKLVETLGTLRKPLTTFEEMNGLLARSRTLFGSNEAAAASFIEQLGVMDRTAGIMRRTYIPFQELMAKIETGKASADDVKIAQNLAAITEGELAYKLSIGEINRADYEFMLSTLRFKEQISNEEKIRHETTKAINDAQSASVAKQQLELELINQQSSAIRDLLGLAVSGGQVAIGSGIKYLISQLSGGELAGQASEGVISEVFGEAGFSKALLDEAAALAKTKYGISITEDQILSTMKERLKEEGVSIEQADQIVNQLKQQQDYSAQMRGIMANRAAEEKTIKEIQEKGGKNAVESMMKQQKIISELAVGASTLRQEYDRTSGVLDQNLSSFERIYTLQARGREGYDFNQAQRDASNFYKMTEIQESRLLEELEKRNAILESQAQKLRTAEETGIGVVEARETYNNLLMAAAEAQARLNDLVDKELRRVEAINVAFDKKASFVRADLAYQQQLISLNDSLAIGIGASAAMREKAAKLALDEAKIAKENVKAIEEEIRNAQKSGASEETINELLKKRTEAQTKFVGLQKEALDMTQKMREGYLEAIDSMQSGAGIFTEIVADQNSNLGALIRTTQEMPRVLKTGAGSGGLTSATQFGPGGISGGFDPNSPEYSKYVLSNMDQIEEILGGIHEELEKSAGSGTKLGLAAKDREEFGGQISSSAAPGQSGTISASGIISANIKQENVDAIAGAISNGVVVAVRQGISNALKELGNATA